MILTILIPDPCKDQVQIEITAWEWDSLQRKLHMEEHSSTVVVNGLSVGSTVEHYVSIPQDLVRNCVFIGEG